MAEESSASANTAQAAPGETTIGFIGTGVMGSSMARHLIDTGYALIVHNRTKSKAEPLLASGAQWADGPASLAPQADIILTILGYPDDVEAVYLGDNGLVANSRPGTLLADMTTSRPDLAQRIAKQARERNLAAIDAPVSGGDRGAREGTLSIMAGADEEAFARALPLFEIMGSNIRRLGPPGSGQHTKMANQIAIAPGMLGVCEALAYASASGLDPAHVLQSIETGAAGSWSLSNLAPRMLAGNFAPGFYVKHFLKDLGIAIESADALGIDLPGLALARARYQELSRNGGDNLGTQALYQLYHKET